MFFMARQAAATFAARAGRTSTTSTREGSMPSTMNHGGVRPTPRLLKLFRPLPRRLTGPLSVLLVLAWLVQMGALVHHAYLRNGVALAADLGNYGSSAQWRGVYYRGEKIGFTVD